MFVVLGMLMLFTARADQTEGKYALILGAGGDPPGATTIFDSGLKTLGGKLVEGGYRTTGAIDGGHAKTQQIVKEGIGPEAQDFTPQNADDQINALAEKVRSGQAKQLLIVVDSHGWPATGKGVHVVSTSDPKSPFFDLAKLEVVLAGAREHGVKVAILDMSCYSGQTLALNKTFPEACVVTAAGANNVGYGDLSESMYKNLRRGRSLEDTFRDTRRLGTSGWPQISTPGGYAAARALADLHGPVSGYDRDYSKQDVGRSNLERCASLIKNQFNTLRSITRAKPDVDPRLLQRLTRRTEAYYAARNAAAGENAYRAQAFTLSGGYQINRTTLMSLDTLIAMAKSFGDQNAAEWTKARNDLLSHEGEARRLITQLSQYDPRFAAEVEQFKKAVATPAPPGTYGNHLVQNSAKLPAAVSDLAREVASTEREIYDSIYENESKKPSTTQGVNPCRDFKF